MIYKIFLLILLLSFPCRMSLCISAPGYPVSEIPDSLRVGANAVIRESNLTFSYQSQKQTIYNRRLVITVLNNYGDAFAEFRSNYDRFSKTSFIKGNIYSANGQLIKKIKSSEIKDYSDASETALYEDLRIQFYEPFQSVYPYTVEYEYETKIEGSFSFPLWLPVFGYTLSLQEADFTVILPSSYNFRSVENGIAPPISVSTEGKNKKYHWELKNFKALKHEAFSPSALKVFPNVLTAPSDFELGGFIGNMNTWQNFAKWVAMLNAGRDMLPDATVKKVQEMVKGMTNVKDIIKAIYKYVQSRTRYVSIQLGIGGLQTIEASVVDEVGYGDCKALSNYTIALLKTVGIKAYYALVNSGSSFPQIMEAFPSNQFDHVIVCIPLKSDTIWLECTSQIIPFNFLGDFTSDRKVLLIKDDGGELVRTKVYPLLENYQYTNSKVDLQYDGNAHSSATIKFGGLQLSDVIEYVHQGREEQKKWLYKEINIPDFQLLNYSLSHDSADKDEAIIQVEMNLNSYAAESGRRLFLPLNQLSHSEYIPAKARERKQNIVVNEPLIDVDSIEYKLPAGVNLEYVPDPVAIKTDFGEYYSSVHLSKGSVLYTRKFLFYKGEYLPSKYTAFQKFFHDIADGDNIKLVLLKTSN
jgi:hypothetical protein